MKAYILDSSFGVDALQLQDLPDPVAGSGEVVLKMKAASLNFRDTFVRKGMFPMELPRSFSPLSDGVGEIISLGEDVKDFVIGDRVSMHFLPLWIEGQPTEEQLLATLGAPLQGVLRERVVANAKSLVKIPDYLSDQEAATLPIAAVTAWHALKRANVNKGDTIVLQGTGGVSLFALQFAKLLGVHVIITSSSDKKLAAAIQLGADEGVNYKTDPDWHLRIKELTNNEGAHHVLDIVGSDLNEAIAAVRPGGSVSIVGMLGGGEVNLNLIPLFRYSIQLNGITLAPLNDFKEMLQFMTQHAMKPIIARVFSFSDAAEAFTFEESGALGKTVIRISEANQ